MARICIFNSTKTVDSAGAAIDSGLSTTEGSAKRSKPVRLFAIDGEVRYISYEFIYVGNYNTNLDLRFYQEFFGDEPSLVAHPNLRRGLNLPAGLMWARECSEIVAAAGAVTDSAVTRTLEMPFDPGGAGSARWLPLVVHAEWVRLAIWVNGSVPTSASLQVYAHVGAHLEEAYLESTGDIPYAGNA